MKKFYGIFMGCLLGILCSTGLGQGIGINLTAAGPDGSAGLDIDFSNKGLLIPRVSLTSTVDVTTIPSPANSLLVYNINGAMVGGNVGYWYWNGAVWTQITTYNGINVSEAVANFEDFVFDAYAGNGANDNQYSFTQAEQNGGTSNCDGNGLYSGGNDYMGLHILNTNANATARAGIGSFNFINKFKFGSQQVIYEARVRVEALSDAAQTFTCYYGMGDFAMAANSVTAGDAANGIYFTYTHSTNAGKWVGITRSASSSTNVNSNVAVVANHWYKLKIVVNASGTKVDFFVDDALIGSSITNIPTANPVKMVFKMEKTVGTTSRTTSIDYVVLKMVR